MLLVAMVEVKCLFPVTVTLFAAVDLKRHPVCFLSCASLHGKMKCRLENDLLPVFHSGVALCKLYPRATYPGKNDLKNRLSRCYLLFVFITNIDYT